MASSEKIKLLANFLPADVRSTLEFGWQSANVLGHGFSRDATGGVIKIGFPAAKNS